MVMGGVSQSDAPDGIVKLISCARVHTVLCEMREVINQWSQ